MATLLLFSDAVTNTYKSTSEAINDVHENLNNKRVVKKTLSQMM